jgi:RNA polymerase sigma-70 factor (ECF subfamily)
VPQNDNRRLADEPELVTSLKARDEAAFSTLVRRYQKRLFAIAYGMTLDREESLDIVQDTFLKVFQKIDTFRGDADISTWLYRITVNLSLNWKRRWKRRLKRFHISLETQDITAAEGLQDDRYVPDAIYEGEKLQRRFWKALKALPEGYRSVFVLKELEGLSYEQIGHVLNLKKGTVSSRLFNARQMLKDSIRAD